MFAFGMAACLVALTVNRILIPKCYYDDSWPTTSTYQGFYQMEKDSVDVLFLGSSCAAAGLNPQEFYDSYGIRSYNLGCEGQSLLTSYYWLEEALRFQSPKVVVLEVFLHSCITGTNRLILPRAVQEKRLTICAGRL